VQSIKLLMINSSKDQLNLCYSGNADIYFLL